ncbi:MAG: TM2 domain-containing protein [Pyrinomonadaceae bacterium]
MATQYVTCPRCSTQNSGLNSRCMNCGNAMPVAPMPMQHMPQQGQLPGADKKIAAGICGILLGGFGVHKFILGYQNEGIILLSAYLVGLVITMITCGVGVFIPVAVGIVGLVEGIIYLTKSDEEFVQTYVVNKKPWF